jgi:hypothetical protein
MLALDAGGERFRKRSSDKRDRDPIQLESDHGLEAMAQRRNSSGKIQALTGTAETHCVPAWRA